jgi:alpha-ketoglutarate-dependent taurine dioxygenase
MTRAAALVHVHGQFDNHAKTYAHIEAKPIAAAMGAEIVGVDCAQVTDAQFAEIEDALFRHKMIFFRGQAMGHADQSAFSRRFGAFAEDAYTQGVPGFPEVQPLIKQADERTGHIFGSGWHTDSPFLAIPPAISMLRSVEIPPFGGDTIWANAALGYLTLSETMKAVIAGLKVHMSIGMVLDSARRNGTPSDSPTGKLAATRDGRALSDELLAKIDGWVHPLVRTHPRTGEKALYCDGSYAIGIDGMTPAESASILEFLVAHMTQSAFTCRLRWEPDMFVMWDNRLCIHQAFNDYDGYRREMYRTTIAGEVPQ